jgi:B9 domain-containing protein 2
VRGWPKLFLEIWQVDDAKRNSIAGYGITGIPFQHGTYKLDVPCWRPKTEYFDKIIGANPELMHKDILISTESRYGFQTETTGKIIL